MRKMLQGNRITINAIQDNDLNMIGEWFNNTGFLRLYDYMPAIPHTETEIGNMIREYAEGGDGTIFAIRIKETGQIIGVTGFFNIVWTSAVATFFVGIGDEEHLGKGIGREAINLMLDYGFNELNLYRIQLNVIGYNSNAIKAYERCGFIREGTCREFLQRDGKRHDLHMYGLLRNEWSAHELEL